VSAYLVESSPEFVPDATERPDAGCKREVDKELEDLRPQLAAKTAELAASELRAGNAETVIEQIVDAIRTQLPTKLSIPTE
jgi:hypothetical protein